MEFAPCNTFVALGGHDASQCRIGRIEGMGHPDVNERSKVWKVGLTAESVRDISPLLPGAGKHS